MLRCGGGGLGGGIDGSLGRMGMHDGGAGNQRGVTVCTEMGRDAPYVQPELGLRECSEHPS